MKKIIYTFLAVAVGFSSCKKEEDEVTPTNYSVVGVWETTYANLDGTNTLTPYSHVYEFFWEDGTYGAESYDFDGNIAALSIGSYSISSDKTSLTINIEYFDDDGDNDYTNGTYETLIVPFNITKLDNSDLHINTSNILVNGASVPYNKRLEKTNMSLPPL